MAVTLTVYEPGNATPLGTLVPEKGSFSWQHPEREDGTARLSVIGTTAAALLAEGTYVRVAEDGLDLFAFVPNVKTRRSLPGGGTALEMSGPGVRWWLHAAQLLQEDTSDCAEPADTRWLGWMSDEFDSSSWAAVASHGTYTSEPWVSVRPEGWPDPTAEYLWSSTAANPGNGEVYFRRTFSTTEENDAGEALYPTEVERIFMGKRAGEPSPGQDAINDLLVNNYAGYLHSLRENDRYRRFANRYPFRVARNFYARIKNGNTSR